jgi:hypothetical protein
MGKHSSMTILCNLLHKWDGVTSSLSIRHSKKKSMNSNKS